MHPPVGGSAPNPLLLPMLGAYHDKSPLRGNTFRRGFFDGGSRSPHFPENAVHMLHTLHMPKAYDVFLQRPSGVLPENVEIVGMVFHRINVF